ncbi:hypothetical protein MKX03_035360 [Papaver bracteatum]|nr:hypothetical protein MKX03_035360 [Papaver bracteatum]
MNVAYILNLQQDIDIKFWGILFAIDLLSTAYETLTSVRPCGPNKKAIRAATYDLKLPEHGFKDIAPWESKLIQDRVRVIRGTT